MDEEGASRGARELDALSAERREQLPLLGVGVGVKDNVCAAGLPCTAGSRALREWRPSWDATAVARLRAAGALVVGKTNCDEFGMGAPHAKASEQQFDAVGTCPKSDARSRDALERTRPSLDHSLSLSLSLASSPRDRVDGRELGVGRDGEPA